MMKAHDGAVTLALGRKRIAPPPEKPAGITALIEKSRYAEMSMVL